MCSACKRSNASRRSFPSAELRALGFPHIAVAGQKGYHGVAIAFAPSLRRWTSAATFADADMRATSRSTLGTARNPIVLHNVYVPAGGDVPDPALNEKFRHKLDFLEAMDAWFEAMRGKRKTA